MKPVRPMVVWLILYWLVEGDDGSIDFGRGTVLASGCESIMTASLRLVDRRTCEPESEVCDSSSTWPEGLCGGELRIVRPDNVRWG